MKTAVEWLVQEIEWLNNMSYDFNDGLPLDLISKAKQMEKKQIVIAITDNLPIEDGVITAVQKAEQYYNETYKNTNK